MASLKDIIAHIETVAEDDLAKLENWLREHLGFGADETAAAKPASGSDPDNDGDNDSQSGDVPGSGQV